MITFIKIVVDAIVAVEVFAVAAGLIGMAAYYGYLKCH